jgi:hypothetical protein
LVDLGRFLISPLGPNFDLRGWSLSHILRAPKFFITLQYEFPLLQVSYLHYDMIRYNIQKTHYAYP